MSITCKINDRNYNSFYPHDLQTPYNNKIFDGDIINTQNEIINSPIRNKILYGILILENNRTFGKHKNKNYYKCTPEQKNLPIFLIPYEIKTINFQTTNINKYVSFKFDNWNQKHPVGQLLNVFGNTTDYNCYCEYYLSYLNLSISNKLFTDYLHKNQHIINSNLNLNINNICEKYNIEKRIEQDDIIFTIDGSDTTDFDDAIGIKIINQNDNHYLLSIYISNVPIILNEIDKWEYINRVSTIYLPTQKIHMLPKILSENICSLVKNTQKITFSLDIEIKNNIIINHTFKNVLINIKENYIYDETKLLNNNNYKLLFETINNLNNNNPNLLNCKYIINDSHELIAYLMILMNYYSSVAIQNNGIYRISSLINYDENNENNNLPIEIKQFVTYWKNSEILQGELLPLRSDSHYGLEQKKHDSLNLDTYIHITSPIRRIVDILNMYKLQIMLNIPNYSDGANIFYNKWTENIKSMDDTFKSIKKIQKNCLLYYTCLNNDNNKQYVGYIIDKIQKDNNYEYQIYIPEIKLISKIKSCDDIKIYNKCLCKIYIFNDENFLYNKIKIQII